MAKGQRIDDHSFWAGRSSKASVLPEETKTKQYSSAEGAGEVMNYEDTDAEIKRAQEKNRSQIKARPPKQSYRN